MQLHLVDFGLASKWRDPKSGNHLQQENVAFFQGNFYFSSFNQLDVKSTSRRDDLHSLIYMLVYMLNRGSIPCIQDALKSYPDDLKKRLAEVRVAKKSNSLTSMCVGRA